MNRDQIKAMHAKNRTPYDADWKNKWTFNSNDHSKETIYRMEGLTGRTGHHVIGGTPYFTDNNGPIKKTREITSREQIKRERGEA